MNEHEWNEMQARMMAQHVTTCRRQTTDYRRRIGWVMLGAGTVGVLVMLVLQGVGR